MKSKPIMAWAVFRPDGVPHLSTMSWHRGEAIEIYKIISHSRPWDESKKMGYRVRRVKIEAMP